MSNPFFDHPIISSPYECPTRHWELDETGQPTQKIIERRRSAKFITPIPKPKKRKSPAQSGFVFDEGKGLSTKEQQYDPETACLLQHWRHHEFSGVRPFFCQVEAVETAIWLTEVAPNRGTGSACLTI